MFNSPIEAAGILFESYLGTTRHLVRCIGQSVYLGQSHTELRILKGCAACDGPWAAGRGTTKVVMETADQVKALIQRHVNGGAYLVLAEGRGTDAPSVAVKGAAA